MFDQQARTRLRDKLDYERWVLDKLEEEHDVFPDRLGKAVIENGDISAQEIAASTAVVSQPRVDEVIQRLYPLVFVASYKCLDMIIEWILEENTGTLSHQWGYSCKNSEVNRLFYTGDLQLPPSFLHDVDVFERLLRLYDELVDHRHAVVHRDQFEVNNDVFSVKNDGGTRYEFDATQLFSLAKAGTVTWFPGLEPRPRPPRSPPRSDIDALLFEVVADIDALLAKRVEETDRRCYCTPTPDRERMDV